MEGLLRLGIDVGEQLALLLAPVPALGLCELLKVLHVPQEVIPDLGVRDVYKEKQDGVVVQSEVLTELLLVYDCLIIDLAALCPLVLLPPPLLLIFLLFPGLVGFLKDGLGLLLLSLLLFRGTRAGRGHAGIRGGIAFRGALAPGRLPLRASSEELPLVQVLVVVFLLGGVLLSMLGPLLLAGLLLLLWVLSSSVPRPRITQKVARLGDAATAVAAVARVDLLAVLVDNDLAVYHVVAEAGEHVLVIGGSAIGLPVGARVRLIVAFVHVVVHGVSCATLASSGARSRLSLPQVFVLGLELAPCASLAHE